MGMTCRRDRLPSVPTMNTLFRVALIASLSAACCFAQTGTVTFYSTPTPGATAAGTLGITAHSYHVLCETTDSISVEMLL